MWIDSPPSHRVSRFLVAILVAVPVAIIVGLLYSDYGVLLVDAGERLMAEMRSAWQS